jgi:hypothetical protein
MPVPPNTLDREVDFVDVDIRMLGDRGGFVIPSSHALITASTCGDPANRFTTSPIAADDSCSRRRMASRDRLSSSAEGATPPVGRTHSAAAACSTSARFEVRSWLKRLLTIPVIWSKSELPLSSFQGRVVRTREKASCVISSARAGPARVLAN